MSCSLQGDNPHEVRVKGWRNEELVSLTGHFISCMPIPPKLFIPAAQFLIVLKLVAQLAVWRAWKQTPVSRFLRREELEK
jgi:hypothetical protein